MGTSSVHSSVGLVLSMFSITKGAQALHELICFVSYRVSNNLILKIFETLLSI